MSNISKYRSNAFDLLDPFFDDFFFDFRGGHEIMKTDILEEDDKYILKVEVLDAKKENIKLSLEDGYLNLNVSYHDNYDEDNKKYKYLRRERHYGNVSRSFYVGENISEEDISASLNDGILTLEIKKVVKKEPEKRFIDIN